MIPTDFETSTRKYVKGSRPAPVHLWNPPFCGDLDIHINARGQWFYQKSEIKKDRLIKLFSNILKKEGDKYFLVTPVEKVGISVDDVPFIANDIWVVKSTPKQAIKLKTNIGDEITLESLDQFNIEYKKVTGEPKPYVKVRTNLYAKIDRKCFYRLIDICTDEIYCGKSWLGFWSNKTFFPVAETEKINS